jgi:hypothetical protein
MPRPKYAARVVAPIEVDEGAFDLSLRRIRGRHRCGGDLVHGTKEEAEVHTGVQG